MLKKIIYNIGILLFSWLLVTIACLVGMFVLGTVVYLFC